jgi:O-antigen/teichoic acid export membrane protein
MALGRFTSPNKRIANNTMMLYIRMFLTMAVTLYTSRIVLSTLGVDDYGIYNVVGGFVTMFGFLNSAMASATQRFLSFEIGSNNLVQLRDVFSMSVNIHFLIAFVIFLIAETIGLWFVKTQLTIPPERMVAANWVYQFSILSLMVNIISVPYNAIIMAHERMNVFAGVSIVEVSLKLLIVFMLQWFGFDKLKLYAVLLFAVALVIRIIYGVYCNRKFKESRFRYYWNMPLFKTLINYAGWNLWGNAASVIMEQGVNILLNIFFGPVVNAARGIAFQVRVAMNQFVVNVQMAMNPQIIKSYATSDLKSMHELILYGAKYSFFLLFSLSLPILIETEIILQMWLKIVPEHTVIFTRLVIVTILIDCISGTLMTAAQASGRIKLYQSVVGLLLILNLPLSYFFLKAGFPPEITFYIAIGISIIALLARLKIISSLVNLKVLDFSRTVVFRVMAVAVVALILPYLISTFLERNFSRFLLTGVVSFVSVLVTIYSIGLSKNERRFVIEKGKQFFLKLK